jgi:hypothetical protein
LFAMAVGLNPTSAKAKAPGYHFTLNQVQAGCVNGNGTLTHGTGPEGYGCTGTGGTVACTATGNCTFTRGLKVARNATIENLIRGEAGVAG